MNTGTYISLFEKKIVYFGKDDTNNEACLCLFFCTPHSALYDLPVKCAYKYISMYVQKYIHLCECKYFQRNEVFVLCSYVLCRLKTDMGYVYLVEH